MTYNNTKGHNPRQRKNSRRPKNATTKLKNRDIIEITPTKNPRKSTKSQENPKTPKEKFN